jgi:hypothetical protein
MKTLTKNYFCPRKLEHGQASDPIYASSWRYDEHGRNCAA